MILSKDKKHTGGERGGGIQIQFKIQKEKLKDGGEIPLTLSFFTVATHIFLSVAEQN
ncbi:MAG: hypothetical protein KDD67_10800 [Ignavibacteriae bacterium]|nr:hypothetical protein [Ignavibacteriota bacterium]